MASVSNGRAPLLQCEGSLQHNMLRRNNYLNAMPGRKSMGAKAPKNEPARLTARTRPRKLPIFRDGAAAASGRAGTGV